MVACTSEPGSLAEIRVLQESSQYAQTIAPLRAMLDEDPSQPEANYLLGRALMRTGDSSSAIWPLRRAMESPEYLVEAGLLLGRAELASRTPRDVIEAAERVLAVEPDNANALTIRAQGYLKSDQDVEALADLERAIEIDPEILEALVPRVVTLIQLERIEEAEAALQRAKEVIDTTDQEVREPLRGRLCVANALFAFEKGDVETATPLYEKCLEAYPTDPLVVKQTVAHFDRLKERDRATEILRKAAEEAETPELRNALGRRMRNLGNTDEQEQILRAEAEQRPTAQAWFTLADFLVLQERYEEACEAFERALEVQEDPAPMTRFAYVDTLIQAKRFDDARRETQKVEQDYMRNLLEGRLLLATGDAAGALREFESGLRLWPNNSTARFLAGQAAEHLGDFDRAVEEYREAIRKRQSTGETDAALYLAQLLVAKGNSRAAYPALHRFIEAHPRNEAALLLAIQVGSEVGREKLVLQSIQRLVKIGKPGLAMERQVEILAAHSGPEAAVEAATASGLDFADPANAVALRALVEQLATLGRHKEARELVTAALSKHPDSADLYEISSRVTLASGGSPEEVRSALERALEIEPEHAKALMGLAELAAASSDNAEAIRLYDRAQAADPHDSSASRAAVSLLGSTNQIHEREERLAAMVARDPRDAFAANELAKSLAERGADLDRALSYAKRAAFFSTPSEGKETLGWIQYLQGEHAAAVELLQAVVESQPEAMRARYRLGLAQKAGGDPQRARESFEAVLSAGGAESKQAGSEIARMDAAASR